MYYLVKMNAKLKKVGFAFSEITLCYVLTGSLENGFDFRFTLKIATKKVLIKYSDELVVAVFF